MRVTLSCGHARTYVIADYDGPSPKIGDVMPCDDCSKADTSFPTIDARSGGSDKDPA